jgi:hypothetical protein
MLAMFLMRQYSSGLHRDVQPMRSTFAASKNGLVDNAGCQMFKVLLARPSLQEAHIVIPHQLNRANQVCSLRLPR